MSKTKDVIDLKLKSQDMINSRYRIREILSAVGASCIVYKAFDTEKQVDVVLKVFSEKWPKMLQRREVEAMQGIDHPNIVKLVDHHFSQGQGDLSYLVMTEIGQAQDLFDYLQTFESKRISEEEALDILHQLLDAVEYLHDEKVVHKDIKLENVLIDQKKKVTLIDLGLAIKADNHR